MIFAFQIALATFGVAMVLLILLHRGRGGGLSDLFGGGISTGLGGSSVAERNLDRITIALAIIWIALIASLLILTKID